MSDADIIRAMIARAGQSRGERARPELDPVYAEIDERSPEVLLAVTRALAKDTPHISTTGAETNWSSFFAEDLIALGQHGAAPPQLALFVAFAEMYQAPRALLNEIAARDLDFQFRVALGLAPRPAKPHHAHVVLTLKKGATGVAVTPEHRFTAGKDAAGVEQIYVPTGSTVINTARVESLRSIHLDPEDRGRVRCAPIANSADGLGGALNPAEPAWSGFGDHGWPAAELGFAIASPLLRLAGGERTIRVELQLDDAASLDGKDLSGLLAASVTAEDGWLDVPMHGLRWDSDAHTLLFEHQLSTDATAVINYDARVHGFAYVTSAPLLRLRFMGNAELGYLDCHPITLAGARLEVHVSGLAPDSLESDHGRLNPAKPFLPFGPEPQPGAQLRIGCREALTKPTSELTASLIWRAPPEAFASLYSNYPAYSRDADDETGNKWFTVASGEDTGLTLFDWADARQPHPLKLPRPTQARGITLELERSFLHDEYRQQQLAFLTGVVTNPASAGPRPPKPYTPTLKSLTISYEASSDTEFEFFHHDCFGQRRERLAEQRVPLLPSHARGGELLIGLAATAPGDSISLLVQVAEGSADPDRPPVRVCWSVLSDNDWLPLRDGERTFDSTNNLTGSGIVTVVLPQTTTTANTLMPPRLVWLRATVSDIDAVCKLLSLHTNGVALRVLEPHDDPTSRALALPAGSIAKLKTPIAAVKSVSQPYPSFGGAPAEGHEAFRTRVAERLRHKGRAITIWDTERIVLEAFPNIHRVKCIPHAKPGSWSAPGNLTLVVVPDLRNHNARDPLRPRADTETINRITAHVRRRAGMGVRVWVRNPIYRPIQLVFKVRFHVGHDFNHHRAALERSLIHALSPWAFDSEQTLTFGASIYRSELLHFVECLAYVDYVTDFRMHTLDDAGTSDDLPEARPATPDMVLVSADQHLIDEAPVR